MDISEKNKEEGGSAAIIIDGCDLIADRDRQNELDISAGSDRPSNDESSGIIAEIKPDVSGSELDPALAEDSRDSDGDKGTATESGDGAPDKTRENNEERIRKLEEDIARLKAEYGDEIERSRGEIAGLQILAGIKDAAFKCGFIEPDEAVLHLKENFNFAGNEFHFKGKRIKENEVDRFIAAAVKKLAENKPHLIRFESKPGSGAVKSETVVHPAQSTSDFSDPRVKRAYEQELKRRGIMPLNPVS
jgi:hypothetical protein